ncbi:hypothetical protein GCM10009597_11640 [Peribacillus frigoritolerans]
MDRPLRILEISIKGLNWGKGWLGFYFLKIYFHYFMNFPAGLNQRVPDMIMNNIEKSLDTMKPRC